TPEQIAFRCAPCAAYGTPELSEYAVTALEGRMACLLEHHGMIAVGSSLEKAFGSPSKSRHSRASTTAVWRSANRPCCRATRSNAYVNPVTALLAPACGGLALGVMEWLRRRWKIANAVDPVEANALRGGRLSARDSVVVSGQTLLSNGCGASVGLEAGYTQIGAGAASLLGQFLNLRRNDLRLIVGCGAAGAIAAAFG